ncbi:MAG: PDZ domain-containing protein [Thermoguttaceae bacterium]|nr:PDZ domain-containing protein [Thermoguttaceae bacterium]
MRTKSSLRIGVRSQHTLLSYLFSPFAILFAVSVLIVYADVTSVKSKAVEAAEAETTTPDSAKDESPENAKDAKDSKPEEKLSPEELKKQQEEKRLREINDENYALYQLLVDTIDQVEANYVKPISKKELIEAAIGGVLNKLDPYSDYIPNEGVEDFRADLENRFGGLGIHTSKQRDKLVVVSPLADSPAYRAGIRPDDVIVAINGESTKGMSLDESSDKLKGPVGSRVTLTVERKKKGTFDVVLTRDLINIPTVSGCSRNADDSWNYWIDVRNKIAYVRISSFSQKTTDELESVLKKLTDSDMRGLILDLRFNPGGSLGAAIEVCDMFVDEGTIVSVKGRVTDEKTWFASKGKTLTRVPMAVLINHYSASAAEIVSACLQDSKRAKIVGERSFGKGSVQNVIDMDGGALKLTTSGYFRPSGHNIHREEGFTEEDEWGVTPDMIVKLNTYQNEQVLWRYQFLDILLNPEKDKDGKPIVPPVRAGEPNRTVPVIDGQISRALQWITSGR